MAFELIQGGKSGDEKALDRKKLGDHLNEALVWFARREDVESDTLLLPRITSGFPENARPYRRDPQEKPTPKGNPIIDAILAHDSGNPVLLDSIISDLQDEGIVLETVPANIEGINAEGAQATVIAQIVKITRFQII